MISEKEIAPRVVSPGADQAPPTPTGSIVVLSDDDVEKVAGGKIAQDAWKGGAEYTISVNGTQSGAEKGFGYGLYSF